MKWYSTGVETPTSALYVFSKCQTGIKLNRFFPHWFFQPSWFGYGFVDNR